MSIHIKSNDVKILFIKKNKSKIDDILHSFYSKIIFQNQETTNFNADIIILDKDELDTDIFTYIKNIKRIDPYKVVIILTENFENEFIYESLNHDIDSIIKKNDTKKLLKDLEYFKNKVLLRNKNIKKRVTLENILNTQSALVLLTDFRTINFCSKSFLRFFNINDKDELFERYENISDIFIPHKDYIHGSNGEIIAKYKNSKAAQKVVLLLSKDFNPKAFHITIDKIEESDLYIITLSNISIMQEKSIKITHKAYIDSLTGVYNRNKFEEIFQYEHKQFIRYKEIFSICILDIDHFKKFNDTHGHLIGDEVLKLLAQTSEKQILLLDGVERSL